MYTKAQFLASLRHETEVMKHLAGKVLPGTRDWRPTPKQRSTLELLQYVVTAGIIPARFATTGSWDHYEEVEARGRDVTFESFGAAMDRQMDEIAALLEPLTEKDLAERESGMPWGAPAVLGQALVDMVLKTFVAYRMQLFLYAKQSGNEALGPSNCWMGRDPKPPTATQA